MVLSDGESPQSQTSSAAEAMSNETAPAGSASKPHTSGTASTFTFLQSLVMIALSYQLLFSPHSSYTIEALEFVVFGLLFILIFVVALPHHLWRTPLIVWTLTLGNALLCANVFYMAGFVEPGLYVTLILLLLIAAVAPSLNLYFVLSVGVCAMYGVIWYELYGQYEPLSEGNLLQFPVLLVMANFYWYILGMRGMAQATDV
jgi:hypothetical protein